MQLLRNTSSSLLDVLHLISNDIYIQPIAILDQQTIGQQVRHIVEHWQILVDNYHVAIVNYANRNRDKAIEQNVSIAIDLLELLQHHSDKKDIEIAVFSIDEKQTFVSSYYRELDNVAEHIIHHAAIIKMAILSLNLEISLPESFGYAPSTFSYKQQECAQ